MLYCAQKVRGEGLSAGALNGAGVAAMAGQKSWSRLGIGSVLSVIHWITGRRTPVA